MGVWGRPILLFSHWIDEQRGQRVWHFFAIDMRTTECVRNRFRCRLEIYFTKDCAIILPCRHLWWTECRDITINTLTGIAVGVIPLQDVFTFWKSVREQQHLPHLTGWQCLALLLLSADIHTCSHTFLLKSNYVTYIIIVDVHVPENGT